MPYVTPYTRHDISLCLGACLFSRSYLLCRAHLSADFVKGFAWPAGRPAGSAPAHVGWPVLQKKIKKNSSVSSAPLRSGLLRLTETLCCVLSPLHSSILSVRGCSAMIILTSCPRLCHKKTLFLKHIHRETLHFKKHGCCCKQDIATSH